MARILTGIQSTGVPHLGNLLGAIIPAIKMSKDPKNDSLFFIADLHSFTTIRDKDVLKQNTYATAAAWLAFGFDTKKNLFYRQSDVTQVCELAWYLNCFTPFPMLANAHSFKDKSDRLSDVNSGLFTYPVLMAADILLYDADIVPVGKDQVQHLEIARDIAGAFNHKYNDSFVLPNSKVDENIANVLGNTGTLISVEIRDEHAQVGKLNMDRLEEILPEFPDWHLLVGNLVDVEEKVKQICGEIDAAIIDMAEPWTVVNSIIPTLRIGGRIACYCPTTSQLEKSWNACENAGLEIEWAGEIIERKWSKASKGGVRPGNQPMGHTAFLMIAAKIASEEEE